MKCPKVLERPEEGHILVSPRVYKALCTKHGRTVAEEEPSIPVVVATTNVYIASNCDAGRFFIYTHKRKQQLSLFISKSTNCLIIANSPQKPNFKFVAKTKSVLFHIPDNRIPHVSYSTCILDYRVTHDFLIFRWPVLLYNEDSICTDDRFRTVDRQRREGELIQSTFEPLKRRPEPYPFFVPALPLDPFWTPSTLSGLQVIRQRNAEARARANAGK